MRRSASCHAALIAIFTLVAACKDPARNATAATVGTAAAVPAPSAIPSDVEALTFSSPESRVSFVGAKVTASHEGQFDRVTGTIALSPSHPEASRITVDIDMASVTVEPTQLNTHLRSPDFFDVAQFPHGTFVSTEIRPGGTGDATHTITGNLTLHGITRSVSFPATVAIAPDLVTAVSEFSINRRDFGIVYPGQPDNLIRDLVLIRLNIKAARRH